MRRGAFFADRPAKLNRSTNKGKYSLLDLDSKKGIPGTNK